MNVRWPRLLNPTQLSQIIKQQKNPLTALRLFNEAKFKYPNYRHNGVVYATMINILSSTGRISEMNQVIDQMKLDSCELRDSIFTTIIKTYAQHGLLNDAISLFKSLHEFNCVNWTGTFNTLLEIMARESKLEQFHRLFIENFSRWEASSQIGALNLLMKALCQTRRSDLALQVFQEMNYQSSWYPDRESYAILMRGLCRDKRFNEATHLLYSMFWRISQKGCGEDITIYRTLLDSLCDDGKIDDALEILAKVLRKGLKTPKSRRQKPADLVEIREEKDVERAKVLVLEALIRGVTPSLSSYTAVASDLYSEGKLRDADKVLDVMREKGFLPTIVIYEAKVGALCEAGKIADACEVISAEMVKNHCVPNSKVYSTLVKGLCDEGKSSLAVGILEKMDRQPGCAPNKDSYEAVVDSLCKEGKFVEASDVLDRMINRGFWAERDIYSAVIKGLCSVGRRYDAVLWLEEMVCQGKVPESCVWSALVCSVYYNKVESVGCFESVSLLS